MTVENNRPQRRSFVHSRLQQAGAEFIEMAGGNIAVNLAGSDEPAIARRMGLVDLSPLPRIGYKGVGAPQWLRQQSLQLPLQANSAVTQTDGTLVAALSAQEHLLLSPYSAAAMVAENVSNGTNDGVCQRLENTWSLETAAQCYQLPRGDSHCWFAVCGDCAGAMLPKLCGVDLRPHVFADNAVAQTSLARVNTIVIRQTVADTAVFYLLTDSASAEYLWDCLLDAMAEFDGAAVGLAALQSLHRE